MKVQITCSWCGRLSEKDSWNLVQDIPTFCSRKCANQRLNLLKWKNHVPIRNLYKCEVCGNGRDYRTKGNKCQLCLNKEIKIRNNKITIGELKRKYRNKEVYWYSAIIRNYCKMYNQHLVRVCQKCGYDKHVEFCHIKPISSYDESVTVGEINSETNLLILCPNHHWEFDNGILLLKDIGERNGS